MTYLLPTLTDKEIEADGGNTYYELNKEYPNWSIELHTEGHILDNGKLSLIFRRGLMLWYIKYHINNMITNSDILKEIYGNEFINIIYNEMEKTNIIRLGIVFQRWKIVLEKMTNNIIGKDDTYMKNIYAINILLDHIQTIIYHHIKYLVDGLYISINKNDYKIFEDRINIQPNFYDEEIYLNILIKTLDDNSILNKKHENPELINYNILEYLL
jgi:hypothetical protein